MATVTWTELIEVTSFSSKILVNLAFEFDVTETADSYTIKLSSIGFSPNSGAFDNLSYKNRIGVDVYAFTIGNTNYYISSASSISHTLHTNTVASKDNSVGYIGDGYLEVFSDYTTKLTWAYTTSGYYGTRTNPFSYSNFNISKTITKGHSEQYVEAWFNTTPIVSTYNSAGTRTGYYTGSRGWKSHSFLVPAKTTYAVSYNANGGSGAPSAQTKWHGESLTLSSTVPTRSGYAFKCWNTASNGTGTNYSAGASYTANAAVTLYAIWNPIISYNANGGSGAPAAQTKTFNVSLTLSSTKPTRTGYTFHHWNTAANNTGTTYNPGGTYTSNSAATLYAIWTSYVTYNGNGSGAGGVPNQQAKQYGTNLTLSSAVPTRRGYQFNGWNTKADGTGTTYQPGATFTSNDSTTLYAKWLKTCDPPHFQSLTVVRCDQNGTANDTGSYFKATVRWSVDTSSQTVSNNSLQSIAGSYVITGRSTGSVAITAWAGDTSGTSGTATAIAGPVSTDEQYTVTVTLTDRAASTIANDILTRARFSLDFKAGGTAVGIGCAAPPDGLEIGYDAQFDGDVTVLGDLVADNLKEAATTTRSEVVDAAGSWTISSASCVTYGHLCSINISASSSSALTAGSATNMGTVVAGKRPKYIQTFGNAQGGGYVSTAGAIYFTPHSAMSAGATVSVGVTYYV